MCCKVARLVRVFEAPAWCAPGEDLGKSTAFFRDVKYELIVSTYLALFLNLEACVLEG